MSFTKIARRNAQQAKREAQRDAIQFATLTPLPERPESLLAAAYASSLVTVDMETREILMISPRAPMPHRADQ